MVEHPDCIGKVGRVERRNKKIIAGIAQLVEHPDYIGKVGRVERRNKN